MIGILGGAVMSMPYYIDETHFTDYWFKVILIFPLTFLIPQIILILTNFLYETPLFLSKDEKKSKIILRKIYKEEFIDK